MRSLLVLALAGLTGLSSLSAAAGDLPAEPRLGWGWSFGGATAAQAPRLSLALETPGIRISDAPLTVAQIDLAGAAASLRLAGMPLWRRDYRMAQNADVGTAPAPAEQSPWYTHQWVYWTLGGLAATAAGLSSISSSGGTENNQLQVSSNQSSGVGTVNGQNGQYTVCGTQGVPNAPDTCVPVDKPGFAPTLRSQEEPRGKAWFDSGMGGMGDLQAQP